MNPIDEFLKQIQDTTYVDQAGKQGHSGCCRHSGNKNCQHLKQAYHVPFPRRCESRSDSRADLRVLHAG
jgi:hypothetical protein